MSEDRVMEPIAPTSPMRLRHYRTHEEMENAVRWLETLHKTALVILWPVAAIALARWYAKRQ